MAIGDPYITRDQLKGYLGIDLPMTQYDSRIDDAVASASREIEQFCGRQFNKSTTATPRRYETRRAHTVAVDDFWTDSGLVVELGRGSDWQSIGVGDFDVYPLEGVVDGVPGWPYYRIDVPGRTLAPCWGGSTRLFVRVTAQWGWAAVPSAVKQAALQLGAETFKLAEAPFGITGSPEFGVVRVRDLPQVARKLNRYVTTPIMVG